MPPGKVTRRIRQINALVQLVAKQLETKTGEADWLLNAMIVLMRNSGRPQVRLGLAEFFAAQADDFAVELEVDEARAEVVVTLVDSSGKPVTAEDQPTLGGEFG